PYPFTLALHDALPIFPVLRRDRGLELARLGIGARGGLSRAAPENGRDDKGSDRRKPGSAASHHDLRPRRLRRKYVAAPRMKQQRSEEHTAELQSQSNL